MVKLYRNEIRWILNMVIADRDNSKALKDCPGQLYAALHNLEYEKMAALAEKLEKILESNAKRIALN
jgi:hypothetical protein